MKKILSLVSCIALLGAGCVASTPPIEMPPTDTDTPSGKMTMAQFMIGSWKIESMQLIGGQPRDVSSLDLTLSFDGERMQGRVCNSMSGPYTVEDNLVTFGPVAQTKMFCEGLPGEVESAFTSGLQTNYRIVKQGENLVMEGAAVFVLVKN